MSGGLSSKVKSSSGVRVKRSREVKAAENYTAFDCGPIAVNHAAACAGGTTGNTFYHDGAALVPVVNDKVYKTKRARNPNTFADGFYKVPTGGKGSITIEVNKSGVCVARAAC